MYNCERFIDIVEDHALVVSYLEQICHSIESGAPLPSCFTLLHDPLATDFLATIAGALKKSKEDE